MRSLALVVLLALAACGRTPSPGDLGGGPPEFDLIHVFSGHVRSWGVVENRFGEPAGWIVTDCRGSVEPDGTLHMTQHLTQQDGTAQTRSWTARPTGPHAWEAIANDMVGTVRGEAVGRAFHWRWTLASGPGKPPVDVEMDQWMYLLDDGSMLNRTTVRKLGVILAEVTEHFARAP